MNHRIASLLCMCVFSFLGGAFVQFALSSKPSFAAAAGELKRFFDGSGRSRLDLGVHNDTPMQNFYGQDGKLRMQFGTYSAAGEAGLPLIGLSDNQGELRMLLRLAGSNESPVLIFKDKQHRDRMVLGLGLNDAKQEPFLAYYDNEGNRHMAFGEY